MVDRPIVFSGPMVCALLDGRKTQTRRLLKVEVPRPPADLVSPNNQVRHQRPYLDSYCSNQPSATNPRGMSNEWCWWTRDDRQGAQSFTVPFVPGDRLWVRESITRFDKGTCDQHVWYRAGGNFRCTDGVHAYQAAFPSLTGEEEWPFEEGPGGGAPYDLSPIHMPRWASRLTLLVTDVRVQRLQDISEGDALSEGALFGASRVQGPKEASGRPPLGLSPRFKFAESWNALHGHGAWDRNPWVCAISFECAAGNIDQMARAA